jgi:hypothetical protein
VAEEAKRGSRPRVSRETLASERTVSLNCTSEVNEMGRACQSLEIFLREITSDAGFILRQPKMTHLFCSRRATKCLNILASR